MTAAVEQHLAERRQVGRRAEEPRVPGDAAHPARRWIMDHAAQHLQVRSLARPAVRRALLRRRHARLERRRRQEHRVLHAERLENIPARELVERQPADPANDVAEQEVVDVAVDEPFARRGGGDLAHRELDRRVGASPRVGEIDIGPEA